LNTHNISGSVLMLCNKYYQNWSKLQLAKFGAFFETQCSLDRNQKRNDGQLTWRGKIRE